MNNQTTYEFSKWSLAVQKRCIEWLQGLPVWHGLEQYVEAQGLTEALVPYTHFEGDFNQTLCWTRDWVLRAQHYCQWLLSDPGLFFARYRLRAIRRADWLEVEPVLDYYLPEPSDESMTPYRIACEPLTPFTPVVCLVARTAGNRFCIYAPTQEGFERLMKWHNAPLGYRAHSFATWGYESEKVLGMLWQQLQVVRSTDYDSVWSELGRSSPNLTVTGTHDRIFQSLRDWIRSASHYAQAAINDPQLPEDQLVYIVGADPSHLAVEVAVGHGHIVRNNFIQNPVGICFIYRIGRELFQMVADTEADFQQSVWILKDLMDEIRAAGEMS